jgi:MFS transporter, DHA2 family, methylenomycin A resistance protein
LTRPAPRGSAFASLVLAGALVPLNSTMIALALSPIAHSFHVSVGGATWLVSAYLVAMAVVQPLGGRLGDLVGHRRAFLAGVAGFALCSAAAALSQNFPLLVALRVAQAVAGGTMAPNAAALLRTTTDSESRGRAFGWFGTGMGLAAAVGPPLGGLLVGGAGWRTIFVVNLPLAATAFLLALWAIERDAPRGRRPRFDVVGAAGTTLVLGCFVATLFLIPRSALAAVALGVASLVIGFAVVRREQGIDDPFLEVGLFRRRAYAAATATIFLHNLCMYSLLLLVPVLVERRLDLSASGAGAVVAALSLAMMAASPAGGTLSDRRGRRFPVLLGSVAIAAGLAAMLAIVGAPSTASVAAGLAVVGLGVGVAGASLQTTAVEAAPHRLAGAAAGLFMTARYAGGIAAAGLTAGAADSGTFRAAIAVLLGAALLSLVSASGLAGVRRHIEPEKVEAVS